MNLLQITTSDIKVDMQIERGRMEYHQEQPTHSITKTGGKMSMQSAPTRVKLDSYERRASMGLRGITAQIAYTKQQGRSAALEAIANYVQAGDAMKNIQRGASVPDAIPSKIYERGSLELTRLAPVDISWEEGYVRQQYETARLAFDWKTQRGEMRYTPSSVKFNVSQYPSIAFQYMGGPIYVPKSADPNYTEVM